MTGYELRIMADLERFPDVYPVGFRVMWDQAEAIAELSRLSREEHERGTGITFSLLEIEVDPIPALLPAERADKP